MISSLPSSAASPEASRLQTIKDIMKKRKKRKRAAVNNLVSISRNKFGAPPPPVSPGERDIEEEVSFLTRYTADSMLSHLPPSN